MFFLIAGDIEAAIEADSLDFKVRHIIILN